MVGQQTCTLLSGAHCFYLRAIRTKQANCVNNILSAEQHWPMSCSILNQPRKKRSLTSERLPSLEQRYLRGQPAAITLCWCTLKAAEVFSRPQSDPLQGLGTGCKDHWTPSDRKLPSDTLQKKKALGAVKTVTTTNSAAVSFKYKSFVHHQRNYLSLKCYSLAKLLQESQLKKRSLMNITVEIVWFLLLY